MTWNEFRSKWYGEDFGAEAIFSNFNSYRKTLGYCFFDENQAKAMDMDFTLKHGETEVSSYLDTLDSNLKDVSDLNEVMNYILDTFFYSNWQKIYSALSLEYDLTNPIDETTESNAGTSIKNSVTADDSTYGFNSSQDVPTNRNVTTSETTGDFDGNHSKVTRKGNDGRSIPSRISEEWELRMRNLWDRMENDVAERILSSYLG